MKDAITSKMRLETLYHKSWEERVIGKVKEYGKVLLFSLGIVLPGCLVAYAYLILITN